MSFFDARSDFFCWLRQAGESSRTLLLVYRLLIFAYQHVREAAHSLYQKRKRGVGLLYFQGNRNFGDCLNEELLRYLGVPFYAAQKRDAKLVAIGSLMEELLCTRARTVKYKSGISVFGTGFMLDREFAEEKFNRPVDIVAVRGRLTLARCERMLGRSLPNVVLGDPGLLIRKIFSHTKRSGLYDLGVVCHFKDRGFWDGASLPLEYKVKVIDVFLPTHEFVEAVASCKFVLSSALHGLICADALGVPNKHIILSDKVEGAGHKFRDYYSVFDNFIYSPLCFADGGVRVEDVEQYTREYQDRVHEIDHICDELIDAFKSRWFDKKGNLNCE